MANINRDKRKMTTPNTSIWPLSLHQNGLHLTNANVEAALEIVVNTVAAVAPLCTKPPALLFDFDDTLMHVDNHGARKGSPYETTMTFAKKMDKHYNAEQMGLIVVTARPAKDEQYQYIQAYMLANGMPDRWEIYCLPEALANNNDKIREWKASQRAALSETYTIIACFGDRPHDVHSALLDTHVEYKENSAVLAYETPAASIPIGVVLDAVISE